MTSIYDWFGYELPIKECYKLINLYRMIRTSKEYDVN